MNLNGEIILKKYRVGNDGSHTLIEEITEPVINTPTASSYFDLCYLARGTNWYQNQRGTWFYQIAVTNFAAQDNLKNFGVTDIRSPIYAESVSGLTFVRTLDAIDSSTTRYSITQRLSQPTSTRLIDIVALYQNSPGNSLDHPRAYTKLQSTCIQTTNDILDITYRFFYSAGAGERGIATYNAYDVHTRSASNNQTLAPNVQNQYAATITGPWLTTVTGLSNTSNYGANLVYSPVTQYMDFTVDYTLTHSLGNSASYISAGNLVSMYTPVGPTNNAIDYQPSGSQVITQNVFGHGPAARGPFKDLNSLPSSKGAIYPVVGSYNPRIPEMWSAVFTSSGNTGTAAYKLIKRKTVGYPFSAPDATFFFGTQTSRLPTIPGDRVAVPARSLTEYIPGITYRGNPEGPALGVTGNTGAVIENNWDILKLSTYEVISYSRQGLAKLDLSQDLNATVWFSSDLQITPSIRQVGVSEVNRVAFVAWGGVLKKVNIDNGAVTDIPGPTDVGVDGSVCYAVRYSNTNSLLWAVFEGAVASSADLGATWTSYLPVNTISPINDTNGSWSNVLQIVLDPFVPTRMILATTTQSVIYFSTVTSAPVAALTFVAGPPSIVGLTAATSALRLDFNHAFKFSNANNRIYSTTPRGYFRFNSGFTWGQTSISNVFSYHEFNDGIPFSSPLLEPDSAGVLKPLKFGTGGVGLVTYDNQESANSRLLFTSIPLNGHTAIKLDRSVYFVMTEEGVYLTTFAPASLFSPVASELSNYEYGWDGFNWVIGASGSKTTHTSPQPIPGGATIAFQDTQPSSNFVSGEFYTWHFCKGFIKDDVTTVVSNLPIAFAPNKAVSSLNSNTVPAASEGVVTELVSLINRSRFAINTSGEYASMSNPAGSCYATNGFGWSDQLIGSGNFTLTFNLPHTPSGTGHVRRVGLVLDSNRIDVANNTGIASTEYTKYQSDVNFNYGWNYAGTVAGTAALTLSAIDGGIAVQPTSVTPHGIDGYTTANTVLVISRNGTTLTWSINGVTLRTATVSANNVYRMVVSTVGGNGSGDVIYRDMSLTYNSERRLVGVGTSAVATGRYDPLYLYMPGLALNSDGFYDISIDGVPATVFTDGQTVPVAGQVTICPGMGKLWFAQADSGKTITMSKGLYTVLPE